MGFQLLAILFVFLAFVLGLVLRIRVKRGLVAWLASCAVVPAYILFGEFVLPYQGGGPSMWQIAMFFGGIYGAVAGGIGVGIGSFIARRNERNT